MGCFLLDFSLDRFMVEMTVGFLQMVDIELVLIVFRLLWHFNLMPNIAQVLNY